MPRPALKKYQKRAIEFALDNPYSIIGLDCGLGKSRVAIHTREKLKTNCLIVCPSYLILNWVKEIRKWGPLDSKVVTFRSGKEITTKFDADYVITSYDLVQKAEHLFIWADMIVLDEATALKSMKAKRTTFMHKNIYENSIERVHLLTGTPIKNRVQEFYSLLAICFYNPAKTGSRFLDLYPSEIHFADKFSFREEYTMEIGNRFIPIVKWSGIRNTDELKEWLKNKYIRVRSKDVLNLAPITYKSILVSDTPDPSLIAAFNLFFLGKGNAAINPAAKANAALRKVEFTTRYVKDLLGEVESVLIYTDHVASAEALAKQFDTKAITGHVPSTVRSDMADAFQRGEGRVLVSTIGSMKEGKDLYRSSHIVFNDITWVPGDITQVIYRIQRIGQKNPCTVHYIMGSPQDEKIKQTIDDKMKTIEQAT
tara:strand:- start:13 stop:1287 length:1275 start_codon:yes stop_codon:yes gene_type:complete